MQIPPNMLYFNCQRGILTGGCLSKWPYIVPKLSWFITKRTQLTHHIHPIEKIRCPCVWRVVRPQKFPLFFFLQWESIQCSIIQTPGIYEPCAIFGLRKFMFGASSQAPTEDFLVQFQPVASLKTNRMQKKVTRNSRGLAQSSEGKRPLYFKSKIHHPHWQKWNNYNEKNPIYTFMFNSFVVNCSDTVAITVINHRSTKTGKILGFPDSHSCRNRKPQMLIQSLASCAFQKKFHQIPRKKNLWSEKGETRKTLKNWGFFLNGGKAWPSQFGCVFFVFWSNFGQLATRMFIGDESYHMSRIVHKDDS